MLRLAVVWIEPRSVVTGRVLVAVGTPVLNPGVPDRAVATRIVL